MFDLQFLSFNNLKLLKTLKQWKTSVYLPNNPTLINKLTWHEPSIQLKTNTWSTVNLKNHVTLLSSKPTPKHLTRPKLQLTYLHSCWIMHTRQISKWNATWERVLREIPVCCHGNKTAELILRSTFSKNLSVRMHHFCYKLAQISFFIIVNLNLVEWLCVTLSIG